jgi:RimJ/RimL family protein N-acetyltransferase
VYVGEKDLWGTGLGRDTVMALCSAAFDAYGADEVELSLVEGNERARRVYEACGFRTTGLGQTQLTSQSTVRMGLPARRFRQVRAEYGV